MQLYFRKTLVSENLLFKPSKESETSRKKPRLPFSPRALAFFVFVSTVFFTAIIGLDGLSPERKAKLQSLFKKIDEEAEQYALIASENKVYPCLSCNNRDTIYLNAGEIWKYGVSINGVKGRYGDKFLKDSGLLYEVQFVGNMAECYKQEKIKIFAYPFLTENIKRGHGKLLRPPGNKYD